MRPLLVVAALASLALPACKKDPLREDMEMFCRAADVLHDNEHVPFQGPGRMSMVQLGPWIASRAKTPEVQQLLQTMKNGDTTIDTFLAHAGQLAKDANVEPCRTITILSKPDPTETP